MMINRRREIPGLSVVIANTVFKFNAIDESIKCVKCESNEELDLQSCITLFKDFSTDEDNHTYLNLFHEYLIDCLGLVLTHFLRDERVNVESVVKYLIDLLTTSKTKCFDTFVKSEIDAVTKKINYYTRHYFWCSKNTLIERSRLTLLINSYLAILLQTNFDTKHLNTYMKVVRMIVEET